MIYILCSISLMITARCVKKIPSRLGGHTRPSRRGVNVYHNPITVRLQFSYSCLSAMFFDRRDQISNSQSVLSGSFRESFLLII